MWYPQTSQPRILSFIYYQAEDIIIVDAGILFYYHLLWLHDVHVQVAVRAVPYRKDFIEALKGDPSITEEQVMEDTKSSIAKLKTNIDEINRFYTEKGLQSDSKV